MAVSLTKMKIENYKKKIKKNYILRLCFVIQSKIKIKKKKKKKN